MAAIERDGDYLDLIGTTHRLTAMPVDGTTWVGMINIESPTNAAMLYPEDARALIRWLTERLDEHTPFKCKCGHGEVLHGSPEVDEPLECLAADCICERLVS